MIRAALIAAALGICSLSSAAQNPTPAPTPTPPTPDVKPAKRAPSPKPKAATPRVWRIDEPLGVDAPLAVLSDDLDFDLVMPAFPPDAPMELMDLDLDIAPRIFELDNALGALSDMDFDLVIPAMPMEPMLPMEPMPPMEPMIPMEPMTPIEPMIPMEPMEPMEPMLPMEPMVALEPMVPMTPEPVWVEPMIGDVARVAPAIERARAGLAAIDLVHGRSPSAREFSGISTVPPESFNQADPADSLYRLARQALNRGEYRRAAQLFADISQKFPNSVYASDARYWRAFALYRLGGSSDLREALATLRDTNRTYRQASLQTDAPALAARIQSALAMQGDADAKRAMSEKAAQPGAACDREDLAVRAQALNSLSQTDPESTTPILARLLARRDECSVALRRAAIYILGRRTDDGARNLVISAARNDPDIKVRSDALRFLAAMPGDESIATIEEMARTPGNEQLQRAAIAALGRSDNPRARQSLRSIAERSDVPENLRITALSSVDADNTADNGAYIRALYPRLETPRLKQAAVRAAAQIGGTDNEQWLLSIVRNQNEPSDVRAMALRYAGRSAIPIGELTRMYDVAGDRRLREQLIALYSRSSEPAATDKLLEIARNGTDPDMRRYAISALARKNDPRTKKLLMEIIDK